MPVSLHIDASDAVIYVHRLYPWNKRALKQAARDMANMAAARMKGIIASEVGMRTGRLAKSVVIHELSDGFAVYPEAPYAAIVDQGAKPHLILPKNVSTLAFFKEGRWVFTKVVHHPGYKGYHYIQKTFDWVRRIASQTWKGVVR